MKKLLLIFLCLGALGCAKKRNQCDPMWDLYLVLTNIPNEIDPADSVRVRVDRYLNENTDNSAEVLHYFEVPTFYKNTQGDIGFHITRETQFFYQLKDSLNPPHEVELYVKAINDCNPDFTKHYFTLVYDTIP